MTWVLPPDPGSALPPATGQITHWAGWDCPRAMRTIEPYSFRTAEVTCVTCQQPMRFQWEAVRQVWAKLWADQAAILRLAVREAGLRLIQRRYRGWLR